MNTKYWINKDGLLFDENGVCRGHADPIGETGPIGPSNLTIQQKIKLLVSRIDKHSYLTDEEEERYAQEITDLLEATYAEASKEGWLDCENPSRCGSSFTEWLESKQNNNGKENYS
jgi:hypothetical protein